MEKTKLPEIKNRRPFIHIDATPDNNYPIRILEAYLADAQIEWKVSKNEKSIYDEMNKAQAKRKKILEEAIKKLQV